MASAATSPQADVAPAAPEEPQSVTSAPLSEAERFRAFIYQLAESGRGEREDPLVRAFRNLVNQQQLLAGPLNLDFDHPLEEVGWLLLAVLLYHQGAAAVLMINNEKVSFLIGLFLYNYLLLCLYL